MAEVVITGDDLKDLVNAKVIQENTTFESIKALDDSIIERAIHRAIRKIESKAYIGRRLIDMKVEASQFEDLGVAIEDLTISMLLASTDEKIVKGYKSEKLSDYSYTIGDHAGSYHVDIDYLIEDLKLAAAKARTRISVI